jgi:hypothetical protein
VRVEKFADRRDTSDTTILDQAGDDGLDKDGPTTSLEVDAVDTPNMRFGRDFFLGDIVFAVVGGAPVTDVLRQVSISVTADRADVRSVIGSDSATPSTVPKIYTAVTSALRRLAAIEKRL